MSTKYKNRLLLCLLALVGLACQTPTQPLFTEVPVNITVSVRSSGERVIPEPTVNLFPIEESRLPRTTTSDGIAIYEERIPVSGADYRLIARGPTDEYIPDTIDVRLPCTDTTLHVNLLRVLPVNCSELGQRARGLIDQFCLSDKESDTLQSPFFDPQCPGANSVAVSNTLPAELFIVQYSVRDVNGNVNSFAAPPASLNEGQQLSITVVYRPQSEGIDSGSITLTLGGTSEMIYSVLAAASDCEGCDCPDANFDIALDKRSEPVCVGDVMEYELDLSSVRNNSEANCIYEFIPEQNFPQGIELNGFGSGILPGGAKLGNATIRFAPTQVRTYTGRAVFRIVLRHPDGRTENCEQKLNIDFQGESIEPECEIVVSSSIFSTQSRGGRNVNLIQCVDRTSNSKTLTIENISDCPSDVNLRFATSSAMWVISPSSLELEPGERKDVTVRFLPTSDDVWGPDNARCSSPARPIFENNLIVSGCVDQTIPLVAFADTLCDNYVSFALFKFSREDHGVILNPSESIILKGKGDMSTLDMFVSDITATTATIENDNGNVRFRRVAAGRSLNTSTLPEAVFDVGCEFVGQCGSATLDAITVEPNEVYIWEYTDDTGKERCGILYVSGIDPSGATDFKVQVHLFYPLL